jgi:NADH:ubiquinone oxidoreductase subunit 6 (subunit J)
MPAARSLPPVIPAAAFFAAIAILIRRGGFLVAPGERDWSVEALGRALLTHYNVVFEALSVVLLLAIVGAILIARREPTA